MNRWIVAHAAVLVVVSGAVAARAQSKQECLDAFEAAQHLRAGGRLIEARERLQFCGSGQCPSLVRADCTQWEAEVLAALPTVAFAARDPEGRDVLDASVSIDARPVSDRIDGREVPLDPGIHAVRIEAPGFEALEQQIVVRAGEKNRIVAVTFQPMAPATGSQRAAEVAPVMSRPLPWAVPVLGGVGVAALTVAALLYFPVVSRANELRASCAPGCSQSEVDSLVVRRDASWVLAGAGVAAIAAGAALFLLRPSVAVAPAPQGATLQATLWF